MDAALLHPGRFIKSQEFKGEDVTYTIASITLEDFEDENKKVKTKGTIAFKEITKLWIINRTNSDCLKGMWGKETDNWIGKRVTLYPAPFFDNFTKEHTTAIRVRGSPDLKEATTITVHLPRKKPVQVKMAKTGSKFLAQDDLEAELAAISVAIAALEPTKDACNAAWSAGLGKRIEGLPPAERKEKTAEFAKRRAGAPSAEAPPPPA